jgi:exonuclease SbcC
LGVEAGTDLEALFRRAIGVPQGTFTAIFLETPTERKKAFDKLLKVEEYRQGAEKLLQTARFIEQRITDTKIRIGRAEGELARFEIVEEELKNFAAQAEELQKTLSDIEKEVAEKSKIVKKFNETESAVNELKSAFERLQSEKTRIEFLLANRENELAQARTAAEKIKTVEADYHKHLAALGKLKELERERIEREKLVTEQRKVETAQINVLAEKKRLDENLEKSARRAQGNRKTDAAR